MATIDSDDWVDLSLEIHPDMEKMEFLPCPSRTHLSEQGDSSLQVSEVTFATHVGTHMDAPAHAIEDGATVEEYSVDRWMTSAVITHVDAHPNEPINVSDIEPTEEQIKNVSGVIICADWMEKMGTDEFYDHPYFSESLAEWLIDMGVEWVGMDFLTPDMPPTLRPDDFTYPIHTKLLEEDIIIVENLTNLSQLEEDIVEVAALPVKISGADGAPMRIAARSKKNP